MFDLIAPFMRAEPEREVEANEQASLILALVSPADQHILRLAILLDCERETLARELGITLGSALFPTLVNGAIMLILFISAPLTNFISTFIQIITTTSQTGTLAPPSETVQNLIAVTNLIIPTDALWHQAAAYLVPVDALNLLATQSFSASTFNIPLINPQDMTSALFIWIICYCLVLPTLAMWRFSRRDL